MGFIPLRGLNLFKMQENLLNRFKMNFEQNFRGFGTSIFNQSSYGFNGMEKDDEIKGAGNSYTTFYRIFDPRLGRWFSVDPIFKLQPDVSTYKAMHNNPIYWVDPEGGTEEERNKAVAAARKSIGYKYKRGTTPASGSTSDCSGMVRYCIMQAGLSDPLKSWRKGQNGVRTIINVSTKIKSVNDIEVGNAVTIKSGGDVYGHVMLISEVNKDAEGNVTSYKVIHAEAAWSSKWGSGGGNVNETKIIVNGTRGYSKSKYQHEFYKWDTPDQSQPSISTGKTPETTSTGDNLSTSTVTAAPKPQITELGKLDREWHKTLMEAIKEDADHPVWNKLENIERKIWEIDNNHFGEEFNQHYSQEKAAQESATDSGGEACDPTSCDGE